MAASGGITEGGSHGRASKSLRHTARCHHQLHHSETQQPPHKLTLAPRALSASPLDTRRLPQLTIAKTPTAIAIPTPHHPDHLPNCAPNRHTGSTYISSPCPALLTCLSPTSHDLPLGAYLCCHCHSITTTSGATKIEPNHTSSIRIFPKHNNVLRACKPARRDITQ